MNEPHNHPNESQLTFGCPACVRRVRVDQIHAELKPLTAESLIDEYYAAVNSADVFRSNVIHDMVSAMGVMVL